MKILIEQYDYNNGTRVGFDFSVGGNRVQDFFDVSHYADQNAEQLQELVDRMRATADRIEWAKRLFITESETGNSDAEAPDRSRH